MTKLKDIARVTISGNQMTLEADVLTNAHLLWLSVVTDLKRSGAAVVDGRYTYTGALRGHVYKLWPTMSHDEAVAFSKPLYALLRKNRIAVCTSRQDPTTWDVAAVWPDLLRTLPVGSYVASKREKRLTASEVGEDRAPGAVTISYVPGSSTEKETQVTTTSAVPAPFNLKVKERQEQQAARRQEILDLFTLVNEPLVNDEIAHFIGCSDSTSRHDLNDLVAEGRMFCRSETDEERSIRFGDTAFARRAQLYWNTPDIPARTSRVVIDGFKAERANRSQPMQRTEINRRLWNTLKRKGPRSRFTIGEISEAGSIQPEVVRVRFGQLRDLGLLSGTPITGNSRNLVYRIAGKNIEGTREQIRQFLEQPRGASSQPIAAQPVAPKEPMPTPAVPAPPASGTQYVPLSEVLELVEELKRLRVEVKELRAQAAAAPRVQVTSLSALLED